MRRRRFRFIGAALTIVVLAALQVVPVSANTQPGYDTIRIDDNGQARLYQVSIDWSPLVLTLPDGGAWCFFTAQLRIPTEPGANPVLTNRKLFASHFDASSATWQPATAMPGEISFGPTGVVDSSGTVHLIYTIRGSLDASSFGTLVYMTSNGSGGWSEPRPIVASETAGHQLSPDLAIDANGGLHLAWQDQRAVDEAARLADASNADVFVSDLNPDGSWSEPVQVNIRPTPATPEAGTPATSAGILNASRPQLVADGDRLVAVWSVYSPDLGLGTATELQWSTRSIADANSWSGPQALFDRGSDAIGGRFLDMADDPTGGVTLLYGRRTESENQLFLQKLDQGATAWGEPIMIASGNRGSYPRIAVATDGTTYVVYNLGSGLSVQVGALAVAPGQTVAGQEEALTEGEEGAQGIATVAVDQVGRVWVVYFHEPPAQSAAETRVLRAAIVTNEPVAPGEEAPSEATPAAEATPAG
jgi:hypothetical protein